MSPLLGAPVPGRMRRVPAGTRAARLSLLLSLCCCLYAYCKLILMCANAIILQKLKSSLNL